MADINRVLFVCTDNTCRSIMAEAVMRVVCRDVPLEVGSRGLIVLFPEPLNPKAVAVLKGNRLNPGKEFSEPLTEEDVDEHVLILTMTRRECDLVKEKFPKAVRAVPIGIYTGTGQDIEEPHGGSLADYGACYEYIDMIVKLAAEKLFRSIPVDR